MAALGFRANGCNIMSGVLTGKVFEFISLVIGVENFLKNFLNIIITLKFPVCMNYVVTQQSMMVARLL